MLTLRVLIVVTLLYFACINFLFLGRFTLDFFEIKWDSGRYPFQPPLIIGNTAICKENPNLNWIVYVLTSSENFERREMLRKTWANPLLFKDLSFKVVFLLGKDDNDVQQELEKEFDKYGDIVQGDFVDSYKNLTIKTVMGLRWASTYCSHVPYALKTDDDIFLNIFEIVRLMRENRYKPLVIICSLWNHSRIRRDSWSKWYVNENDLPGLSYYPQYCGGALYVMSRQLVKQLYEASKSTSFFKFEDVYVTGLLTKKVPDRIAYVNLAGRMTHTDTIALESYRNQNRRIAYDIVHVQQTRSFIGLWNALLDRLTDSQKIMLREHVSNYKVQ